MSRQNSLVSKRERRAARRQQKARAKKKIPHAGVIVSRKLVRQHVYLRMHGLPYSARVAALGVLIAA